MASDDLAAVKIWNGKNVEGIVVEIHSHGVMVNIPCLPVSTKAYIHISQVSDGYIENLKTSFTVGQSVTVKVRFLRKDKTAWEVSRKAVLNEALWSNEFPEFSEAVGYVERIGDFGALIKLKDEFVGRISAFQLSFFPKDQQLEVGTTIEVRIGKWDFSGQCPLLIPKIKVEEAGLIEAVEIRAKVKANKSKAMMLRAKARVNTASYGIVNCDIANFIKIQERFAVGKQVRVSIQLASWSKEGFQGEIALSDSEKLLYGQAPQVGSVIEVPVVSVLDYGAFCLVADNIFGLVHHQLVVQDKKPELGKYVGPGDLLRVRVASLAEKKGFVLEFLAMVTPFSQDKEQADSLKKLFELKQEKRKHISGGFKRSVSFRTEVLNIFNHTCVLCGKSQRISEDISVAEAAHIVPHSQRGADIIENAICLCPVCHWAFDKGLLGINPEGKVIVSGMIANDSDVATSLLKLNGRQIVFPELFQMPVTALAWHMRNTFWDIG